MFPVFIGGHPRSGTTFLGSMLGSHSECICTPESPFKINALRQRSVNNGYDFINAFRHPSATGKRSDANVRALIDFAGSDWKFKIWGIPIATASSHEIDSYQSFFRFIVRAYGVKNGKPSPGVWVDHTPQNIKYALLLKHFFADAKFIHIVRDGRAVGASIIPLDWGPNTIYRAARSWVSIVSRCLEIQSSLGDDTIICVKYEDLVTDPETVLRWICLFLGISYEPRMILGSGYRVPGYTADQHSLLGQKPDVRRATAWEKELTPRQIEIFESIAGKLLLSLGYTLRYGSRAREISLLERITSGVKEAYKTNVANKNRLRQRIKRGISEAGK